MGGAKSCCTYFQNTSLIYSICWSSKTSFTKYLNFLTKNKLKYLFEGKKYFSNNIEGVIKSQEKILNYFQAKKIIHKKIKKIKNIKVFLNTKFKKNYIKNYDQVIVCTYDQNNNILNTLGVKPKRKFKFELIEKILIKLPKKFNKKSSFGRGDWKN